MKADELARLRPRLVEFTAQMLDGVVRRSDQRVKGELYVRGLLTDGQHDLEQVLASTGPDQVESVRLDEQGNLVIPPLSAEDVPVEATAVKEESAGPGRWLRSRERGSVP